MDTRARSPASPGDRLLLPLSRNIFQKIKNMVQMTGDRSVTFAIAISD
jgi:hypothetical protein